ncbi:MAG: hypothetical protein RJA81_290 [Planctomycetota bacterium]|jgi:hypothetical protein
MMIPHHPVSGLFGSYSITFVKTPLDKSAGIGSSQKNDSMWPHLHGKVW